MADLKPCPFCGSADVGLHRDDARCHIECHFCGGSTVEYRREKEVVEWWNRRAVVVDASPLLKRGPDEGPEVKR